MDMLSESKFGKISTVQNVLILVVMDMLSELTLAIFSFFFTFLGLNPCCNGYAL